MATISPGSRYLDTPKYADASGLTRIGSFVQPKELITVSRAQWDVHVATQGDVSNLDALAVKYYGPGNERFRWLIARVNGISDEDLDVIPGKKLVIPPRSLVSVLLARPSANP